MAIGHESAWSNLTPSDPCDALLKIWWEVRSDPTLGMDDNFFAFGADSMAIAKFRSLIRERLDVNVAFRKFFERPTVRQLSELAEFGERKPGSRTAY